MSIRPNEFPVCDSSRFVARQTECQPSRWPLHSFDEFTRLRSIIVGSPYCANHPEIESSFENFFRVPQDEELRKKSLGPIPKAILDEIEEDIQAFLTVLNDHQVEVHRSEPMECSRRISSPFWETSQLYSLMPRDCLLVMGNLFIETPSPTRARFFEVYSHRPVVEKYLATGAHILSGPKPILGNESYAPEVGTGITENEILFDAANCVRLGLDIFMDVNNSANHRACQWLERTLQGMVDSRIRVHPMHLGYDHVDVTLVPLRPGCVLIDPVKVTDGNIPSQFSSWDKVTTDEVMPVREYGLPYPLASNDGIGRNVLMLDSQTVVVDKIQLPLIRQLEKRGFQVIPLQYRHGRTLGGSWHCITLDTNRDGKLQSYF